MYGDTEYSGFHESYYAHNCPIISEKDVVYSYNVGNSCGVWLKRWWKDLFLLSSTHVRCHGFYNSSHAMRIERFRQYRSYPSRIHPMSKFISFWNCVIVFAIIVNKILFRFTSTIIFDDIPLFFYYCGAGMEVIIIVDIFINLKTGYVDQERKKVILDAHQCYIHYCSTKLFLHMMSAIPMHWLMFLRYGTGITCGLCKCNRFIATMKILSIFSLYRVFETTVFWTWKRSTAKTHLFNFLRISTVGLVTMLQFYDVVDVLWMLTMLYNEKLDSTSFIAMLIVVRYGITMNAPNYMVLCYDMSRIFKSVLLFSFGLKRNSGFVWDKMSSIVAYIIANGFYIWALLECYAMISREVYPKDRIMNTKTCLVNLLSSRQLSNELKHRFDQYFDFKYTELRIFEQENGLYKTLPHGLKREIVLSCYSKLLMRVNVIFDDWPIHLIEVLAMMLQPEIYLSNDIVAEAWVSGQGLMIIDVGVLAIYNVNHEEKGHLIDGDYFGEISLVTDNEVRMSYVLAVTPCRVLVLNKLDFRRFMRNYPQVFYALTEKLRRRYKMINQEPDSLLKMKEGNGEDLDNLA